MDRGVAVGVGGVMPLKSIGRCLMPFDRTAPIAPAEHRTLPTPYGVASGTLLSTARLSGYAPCSWRLCFIRTLTATPLSACFSNPRAQTMMWNHRLCLSGIEQTYCHCKVFAPKEVICRYGIYLSPSVNDGKGKSNMFTSVFTGADTKLQFIAVKSTKEALLARNWKRAEQGYSFSFWLKNLQTSLPAVVQLVFFHQRANSPFCTPYAMMSTSKQNFDSR